MRAASAAVLQLVETIFLLPECCCSRRFSRTPANASLPADGSWPAFLRSRSRAHSISTKAVFLTASTSQC